MKDNWKLHRYESSLDSIMRRINDGTYCSKINKGYLLKYYDSLLAEGLTIPRIAKCLRLAAKIDEVLKKDLRDLCKDDIVHYLGFLEKSDYAQWTKSDFKIGLKKFIRWLNDGKEPDYFKLIKTGVRNQSKLLPQEVMTEQDAMKLISSAPELRDKALISCIYESGCRIGEILTLKMKHVVFDEYGCVLHVNGKTGVRQVRIISSTQLLGQWISDHPFQNPDAYLWCSHRYSKNELISYQAVTKSIRKAAKIAGITKKVNPHSFRHARATHMANKLTEAQMKMYFGWTQASKMASVYVHLSGRDVDNTILEVHGIKRKEDVKDTFAPKKCRCGQLNTPTNKYCSKCDQILDLRIQMEVAEKKKDIQDFLSEMMKSPEMLEKFKSMVQAK